jgi:hypothetical protein
MQETLVITLDNDEQIFFVRHIRRIYKDNDDMSLIIEFGQGYRVAFHFESAERCDKTYQTIKHKILGKEIDEN